MHEVCHAISPDKLENHGEIRIERSVAGDTRDRRVQRAHKRADCLIRQYTRIAKQDAKDGRLTNPHECLGNEAAKSELAVLGSLGLNEKALLDQD